MPISDQGDGGESGAETHAPNGHTHCIQVKNTFVHVECNDSDCDICDLKERANSCVLDMVFARERKDRFDSELDVEQLEGGHGLNDDALSDYMADGRDRRSYSFDKRLAELNAAHAAQSAGGQGSGHASGAVGGNGLNNTNGSVSNTNTSSPEGIGTGSASVRASPTATSGPNVDTSFSNPILPSTTTTGYDIGNLKPLTSQSVHTPGAKRAISASSSISNNTKQDSLHQSQS